MSARSHLRWERLIAWAGVLVLLGLPVVARAQFTYITINGTLTITGYTGPGGAVTIPTASTACRSPTWRVMRIKRYANLTCATICSGEMRMALIGRLGLPGIPFADKMPRNDDAFCNNHCEEPPEFSCKDCPVASLKRQNAMTIRCHWVRLTGQISSFTLHHFSFTGF